MCIGVDVVNVFNKCLGVLWIVIFQDNFQVVLYGVG